MNEAQSLIAAGLCQKKGAPGTVGAWQCMPMYVYSTLLGFNLFLVAWVQGTSRLLEDASS